MLARSAAFTAPGFGGDHPQRRGQVFELPVAERAPDSLLDAAVVAQREAGVEAEPLGSEQLRVRAPAVLLRQLGRPQRRRRVQCLAA
jgi:hypothetical protein